jgi:hypothetical protein
VSSSVAIFGLDIADLVANLVRALVDLVVPDFGADWASRLVTWLVALPPVTGGAFPSLNRYAADLTTVGFGVLGAKATGTPTRWRPRRLSRRNGLVPREEGSVPGAEGGHLVHRD